MLKKSLSKIEVFSFIITLVILATILILMPTVKAEENFSDADVSIIDNWESVKTLKDTKLLIGIDGEPLTCFEYAPTGYSIYDNYGELWERCEDAPSPYADFKDDGNLIYAGPKQYLKINKIEKLFTNLYSKEKYLVSSDEFKLINNSMLNRSYKIAIDVTEVREKAMRFTGDIIEQGSVGGVLSSVNTTGANTGKSCGGVAAALTLHYYDQKYPNKNINSNDDFNSLLSKLVKSGDVDSSTADTIKPVVKKYLQNNGGDCFSHNTLLGAFTTNNIMINSIKAGNPVIIFAAVEDPSLTGSQSIAHAFVAHTYHGRLGAFGTRKYSYVCHFGWSPAYNYVEVHNAVKYMTIGTSYRMELIS